MGIKLTEKQRENLVNFLMRVQLTGAEVPAYLEVAEQLNKPFRDDLKNNNLKSNKK